MFYLHDTRRENGCLRVIPGSHCNHNPLHDVIDEPHAQHLQAGHDLTSDDFSDRPDEIDVPIKAGDLLVGDSRLLHATHANTSDQRRTVLTLWYQTDLPSLPEKIQAQMVAKTQAIPDDWDVRDTRQSGRHHAALRGRRRGARETALPTQSVNAGEPGRNSTMQ